MLVIIGGIIGFFASIAKDYLIESKKEKDKIKSLKREKLEETFILVSDFYSNSLKSLESKENTESAKIGMIIRFYFKDLLEGYQLFLEKSKVIIVKTTIPNSENLTQEELIEHNKEYIKFLNEIEKESKKYC
ncbi:MAG: hypothetical protein K2P52_05140 [Campylobacterales bacterium]|nr:hypothetical protein [Campylobacterales bacterium]